MGNNQGKEIRNPSNKAAILSAGAILWTKDPFLSEIAVVHRSFNGGEWCLPEGELQKDETIEQAALREVKKETGCSAKIFRFAALTKNHVEGTLEQVFYWHMVAEDESGWDKRDKKVDQIIWLPPAEASKLLDHKDQRKLIKELLTSKVRTVKPKRLGFSKDPYYHRLAGALHAYRLELENKKPLSDPKGNEKNNWFRSCINLISDGGTFLNSGNLDEAWKCFFAAQRMEIYSLGVKELKVKAAVVVNEAQKLSQWRKNAIEELLGKPEKLNSKINEERVYQAALLRDEHYANQAFKDTLLRNHILILVKINGILLSVILLDFILKAFCLPGFIPIIEIILFGLFGGAFSAVVRVPASIQSSKIPELAHDLRITLLRIFIGAASALIIYLFIESEFVKNIFDFSINDIHTKYIIAFASGFSERLVLRAVEAVTKEK